MPFIGIAMFIAEMLRHGRNVVDFTNDILNNVVSIAGDAHQAKVAQDIFRQEIRYEKSLQMRDDIRDMNKLMMESVTSNLFLGSIILGTCFVTIIEGFPPLSSNRMVIACWLTFAVWSINYTVLAIWLSLRFQLKITSYARERLLRRYRYRLPDDHVVGRMGGQNLINTMFRLNAMIVEQVTQLVFKQAHDDECIPSENTPSSALRVRAQSLDPSETFDLTHFNTGVHAWTHVSGAGLAKPKVLDLPFFLEGETLVRNKWEVAGEKPMLLRIRGEATLYIAAQCPPLGGGTTEQAAHTTHGMRKAIGADVEEWPREEMPVVTAGFHPWWRGASGHGEFRRCEGYRIFVDANHVELPVYKIVLASPEESEYVDVILCWKFKAHCEALIVVLRKGHVHCKEEDWPMAEFCQEVRQLTPLQDYSGFFLRRGISCLVVTVCLVVLAQMWTLGERPMWWLEPTLATVCVIPIVVIICCMPINIKATQTVLSMPMVNRAEHIRQLGGHEYKSNWDKGGELVASGESNLETVSQMPHTRSGLHQNLPRTVSGALARGVRGRRWSFSSLHPREGEDGKDVEARQDSPDDGSPGPPAASVERRGSLSPQDVETGNAAEVEIPPTSESLGKEECSPESGNLFNRSFCGIVERPEGVCSNIVHEKRHTEFLTVKEAIRASGQRSSGRDGSHDEAELGPSAEGAFNRRHPNCAAVPDSVSQPRTSLPRTSQPRTHLESTSSSNMLPVAESLPEKRWRDELLARCIGSSQSDRVSPSVPWRERRLRFLTRCLDLLFFCAVVLVIGSPIIDWFRAPVRLGAGPEAIEIGDRRLRQSCQVPMVWTAWRVSWPPFFRPTAVALGNVAEGAPALHIAAGRVLWTFVGAEDASSSRKAAADVLMWRPVGQPIILPEEVRGLSVVRGMLLAVGDSSVYEVRRPETTASSPSRLQDQRRPNSALAGITGAASLVLAHSIAPLAVASAFSAQLPNDGPESRGLAVGSLAAVVALRGRDRGLHLCSADVHDGRLKELARLDDGAAGVGFVEPKSQEPWAPRNISGVHVFTPASSPDDEPVLWAALAPEAEPGTTVARQGAAVTVAALGLTTGRLLAIAVAPKAASAPRALRLGAAASNAAVLLSGNATHLLALLIAANDGAGARLEVFSAPYPTEALGTGASAPMEL